MPDSFETARRAFLRKIATVGAALPLAGIGLPAFAQEKAEDGHALNYVTNYKDATDNPRHREGAHCATCVFWQGGDSEWGNCQHPQFRNVQVNSNGWCSAHAPRG